MIPYEDLVIALQTWRAKQGLPVAQMSGQLTPPPVTPPPPPQPFLGNVATPPPLAPSAETQEDSLDVEGALIEEHYENEGDDFAMAFAASGAQQEEEAPERPTEANLDEGTEVASPGGRRGRGEDW
ncbi:MAG: hypothetical protein AB7T06_33195 [Kofleriaceae bacterium]